MTDPTARQAETAGAETENGAAKPEAQAPDPVAAAQREAAEFKDKLLRTLAEMENLRRRTEREVTDARVYGIASFARDVLAVADNMHRALETIGPELREQADAKVKALIEGVELTERELLKSLEKNGVRKFSPEGEKFDPNVHQAMYEIQNSDLPPGSVGQVIQSGYMIGDRVLRPALVGVVKAPPKQTANDNPQPDNSPAN
jgi:molecular chaperone GrpE